MRIPLNTKKRKESSFMSRLNDLNEIGSGINLYLDTLSYDKVYCQVTTKVSAAPLVTTPKVCLQSIVVPTPVVHVLLNIPASVIDPVPIPAPNVVALAQTVAEELVYPPARHVAGVPKLVSPIAGAIVPVPIPQ
jgi:hypothetical protein